MHAREREVLNLSASSARQGKWTFLEFGISSSTDASTFRKLLGDRHITPATLLAREIIQNGEDASFMSAGDSSVPFRMDCQFVKRRGDAAESVLDAIDFEGLSSRLIAVGIDQAGLPRARVREVLEQNEVEPVVDVLAISDFGARGLVGDLEEILESGWYNCLFSVGTSRQKSESSGGSYGFGKSAFVNGSLFSVVVVYTKTGPSSAENSRYFGAVAYWNGHSHMNRQYTGIAALGDPDLRFDWLHKPYEDKAADELAALFGFPVRGDDKEEWGTTIGILYPVVERDDLVAAIEEYWWPALEGVRPKMDITITDDGGARRPISPKGSKNHSFLPTMRAAYEIASGERRADGTFEYSKDIKDSSGTLLGTFAAVADPQTCFDPKLPGGSGHANLSRVALTRKPRMVVQYLEYGKGVGNAPYVEGIFVCADDVHIESALRSCEPAEHNLWWPSGASNFRRFERAGPGERIAASVKRGIEEALDEFKAKLRPPDTKGKTLLKDFGGLLGKLLRTPGEGGVGSTAEPITIHFLQDPLPVRGPGGALHYETIVEFGLEPRRAAQGGTLRLGFTYSLVADEDGSGSSVPASFVVEQAPDAFDCEALTGQLSGEEVVRLRATSAEVLEGQSVRARPTAAIVGSGGIA